MRRLVLGLAVLALLGAAYGLSALRNAPPAAEDVIAALRASDPALEQAEISLLACRLVMRRSGPAQGVNAIQRSEIDVDLSLFDTSTARIKAPEEGPVVLLLSRRPVSAAMLDQADVIVQALPGAGLTGADGQPGTLDRETLGEMLGTPGAALRFHVPASVIEATGDTPARLQASERAPLFYDFAEAVRAAPEPRSYAAALTFAEAAQTRETLLAGLLAFPAALQFRAPDTDRARHLGETLFRYTAAHCPDQSPAQSPAVSQAPSPAPSQAPSETPTDGQTQGD